MAGVLHTARISIVKFLIAQWIECLPSVQEVMGSIPTVLLKMDNHNFCLSCLFHVICSLFIF